uniref:Small ribosomal subunit protein uS2 C-terminal domain-containing protein n=1 Tax=Anolis carolinensis TaxID=28377 RepID=A0A803TXT2_ANOCA
MGTSLKKFEDIFHLGGINLDFQMEQYIYKRKSDGIYIINLKRAWEKLLLAACATVAIENPADRAVLKFAAATSAAPISGCFTPGTFTDQIQAVFREPCLLVVTDPRADHQPLSEASPPLPFAILILLCVMWILPFARSALCGGCWLVCGTISHERPWEVMPDLYLYQDPEEIEKEEQAAAEKAVTKEEFQVPSVATEWVGTTTEWS